MDLKKVRFGYIPDLPDFRDHVFSAPVPVNPVTLPPLVDLRGNMPKIYDQGNLGSCVANSVSSAIEYDLMKQKLPDFMPSRLFVYYNTRAMEGTATQDSGCMIRDAVKSVNSLGVCPEKEWPYDITKFAQKPLSQCYKDALKHKTVKYQSVIQDLNHIKSALASGFPVVFGFAVYESFESDAVAKTGIVPMPLPTERSLGGHSVSIVGYDDSKQMFIVRNSWGTNWGDKGYFYQPYQYVTNPNLSADFWVIQVVS